MLSRKYWCRQRADSGYCEHVREAELWSRLDEVLSPAYSRVWAQQVVLAELDGRTVTEALAAGIPCKKIWRAAWLQLELPPNKQ